MANCDVTAPSEAEETRAQYLAKTPVVYRGAGALQAASLVAVFVGLLSPPGDSATVQISPAQVGDRGHGVAAVGTF